MTDAFGRHARSRIALEPFDYDGVRLLPGRFSDQAARARHVYHGIPNDDLLKGFREAAGRPAPGRHLGGWCQKSSAVIFGQVLSGLARMGRATGDRALLDKAVTLFEGWRETIGPAGDVGMRIYEWEKLTCGLVDVARYAGHAATLPVLEETTAWAARAFDRSRTAADNYNFQGGTPGVAPGNTREWYTLPENLYRAYLLTGQPAFRDFADVWRYEAYWSAFADAAGAGEVVAVHAYSHVNSLASAAMAHAVTGDERYLRTCVNGYDFVQGTQVYATGGFGPDERLMPADGSLGRSLELCAGHAEIPCGTWAAFKLCRYLMSFTGEARFGDWIETLLYNGIGAALPTEPDGRTYYYGDYRLSGGIKQHYWHAWPCCSGTYWQAVADYHNVIYFRDAEGLFVNLFVPSDVTWSHAGTAVRVRQETAYPEAETTTLAVEPDRPVRLAVRVRVPGWSDGLTLHVNGERIETPTRPGRWATIERVWQRGDRVTARIPLGLRTLAVDPQHPRRVAVLYGAVVLAQDEACCRRPLALGSGETLARRLVQEEPGIRFRILDTAPERHTRFLQPFYSFPAFWPYWVYFDLDAPPLY
jgi:uncharacterized protein